MSHAYYNEHDPKAAAWLRELIAGGHIMEGEVDERSITEVTAGDLRGFTRCHFFAGIGGWDYALRIAGWDSAQPVWTGSCPCQPFSTAGKQRGTSDERHLWPEFSRLIRECRPATIFGEQVASPVALQWLDTVSADLEGEGYAVGAADLSAASVGAPHIRQRLYWVADAMHAGRAERWAFSGDRQAAGSGCDGSMADSDERQRGRVADGEGCECDGSQAGWIEGDRIAEPGSKLGRVGDTEGDGRQVRKRLHTELPREGFGEGCELGRVAESNSTRRDSRRTTAEATGHGDCVKSNGCAGWADATNGFWGNPDWLLCRDGKWRPVESGTFPLAHGVPGRVGLLRGYGNAIVPQVAAEFIKAFMNI